MAVAAAAVRVLVGGFDRDEIEVAVTDTRLCGDCCSERLHVARIPLQNHRFEAILMVEMDMHGRDRQIVMRMLLGRQSFRHSALVVIEDVRQTRDALIAMSRHLLQFFESIADEIAHCLAAILVAALLDVTIKGFSQGIVDGNRQPLHGCHLAVS